MECLALEEKCVKLGVGECAVKNCAGQGSMMPSQTKT